MANALHTGIYCFIISNDVSAIPTIASFPGAKSTLRVLAGKCMLLNRERQAPCSGSQLALQQLLDVRREIHHTHREIAYAKYARLNVHYPDVLAGLSCLFRPGASLDELAQEGSYRNAKLSVAIAQRLISELATIGCALALYVTPVAGYPDHHTLAVMRGAALELTLHDDPLDALIRAMIVVDNPYQPKHS